jgi:mannosyl-oligosaccharide glucosidase
MSKGGIRSLSLSDSDYASEENYWRGAVWMPINYMILRACKKYYWNI